MTPSAATPERVAGTRIMQRVLIAVVQVFALTAWFSATAVLKSVQHDWGISETDAVWLTASTQIGFVLGAVISSVLNLADRFPAQHLLAASAAGAALTTAGFAALSRDLASAVALRAATGVFLAGVYPVGMKLMVSWAPANGRARLMGILLGALTLGSALPHLIGVLPVNWHALMLTSAVVTLLGGLLALAIRPGPYGRTRRTQFAPSYVIHMFRDSRQRNINFGYFGHMWELYALWTWMPAFATAALTPNSIEPASINLGVFLCVGVAGVVGCLIGGWSADRWGRPLTAIVALVISGACCLASPLAFHAPWPALLMFGCVWGASVIADSGVFSTMLSEAADDEHIGTALTAQTAVGFTLTAVSIQLIPIVAALAGWHYALLLLSAGPIFGIWAICQPRRARL